MLRLALAVLVFVLAAPVVSGQRTPARAAAAPEASLRRADLEAHLRFLASDELMGRAPGTPGIDAAARYIAEQFRRFGVVPVPGQTDYFQRFTLTRIAPPHLASVFAAGDSARAGADVGVLAGGPLETSVQAVYVGYGANADHFTEADVRGRVVVARAGLPGLANPRLMLDAGAAKRRRADSLGAVAFVELVETAVPWSAFGRMFRGPRTVVDYADGIPHLWVNDASGGFRAALEAQVAPYVRLSTEGVTTTTLRVQNVVGFIPGRDRSLAAEIVALSAHHDHLGAGMRSGADATPADSIFNGARDNGTGTVALLAAAEALAQQPPKRSLLLLSFTAEEMGLVGARYFADHPTVALDRIVYDLNVDTGGISDTTVVSLVGAGRTTATPLVERAMQAFGLRLYQSVEIEPLFNASDNAPLAAKGIPAPTFSPGFRSLRDPLVARYYHRAADHADASYPFGYLLRFSQAYARAARLIADAPVRPRWTTGDAFESTARALYGSSY